MSNTIHNAVTLLDSVSSIDDDWSINAFWNSMCFNIIASMKYQLATLVDAESTYQEFESRWNNETKAKNTDFRVLKEGVIAKQQILLAHFAALITSNENYPDIDYLMNHSFFDPENQEVDEESPIFLEKVAGKVRFEDMPRHKAIKEVLKETQAEYLEQIQLKPRLTALLVPALENPEEIDDVTEFITDDYQELDFCRWIYKAAHNGKIRKGKAVNNPKARKYKLKNEGDWLVLEGIESKADGYVQIQQAMVDGASEYNRGADHPM